MTFIYGLEVIFIWGFTVVFRLLSDLEPLPFWLFLSVLISYLLARYYEEEKQALKISSYISLVFVTIVTGFSAAILYLDPSLSNRLFACSVLVFFIFNRYLSHLYLRRENDYSQQYSAWLKERGYVFYGDENWNEEDDDAFFEKYAEELLEFKNRPEFKGGILTFIENVDENWLGFGISIIFLIVFAAVIMRSPDSLKLNLSNIHRLPIYGILFFVAMFIYSVVQLWPGLYVRSTRFFLSIFTVIVGVLLATELALRNVFPGFMSLDFVITTLLLATGALKILSFFCPGVLPPWSHLIIGKDQVSWIDGSKITLPIKCVKRLIYKTSRKDHGVTLVLEPRSKCEQIFKDLNLNPSCLEKVYFYEDETSSDDEKHCDFFLSELTPSWKKVVKIFGPPLIEGSRQTIEISKKALG